MLGVIKYTNSLIFLHTATMAIKCIIHIIVSGHRWLYVSIKNTEAFVVKSINGRRLITWAQNLVTIQ